MRHGHEHHGERGRRGKRGDFRGAFRGFRRGMAGSPFGPFAFGPGARHEGGNGRRGNVRAAILALLNERSMHGYEMIQELDQRTGGAWRPSPGSVYPTLQLLEDEGLIVSQESGGRKAYSLTEAGKLEAAEAAKNAPWTEFSEDTVSTSHDAREAISSVLGALRQIGVGRDPKQWNQAVEVLNETKRKLYAILAAS
jgi:DNA-binding PadR family transcriptional regulator